jgi:predicted Zn finger-like uncharacterized protein
MIVECEECGSRFRLDEDILKEEGSRVRCSVCKNVFTVFPPESGPREKNALKDARLSSTEEAETKDLSGTPEVQGRLFTDEAADDGFDKLFGEALEKEILEGMELETEKTGDIAATEYGAPDLSQPGKWENHGPRVLLITLIAVLVFIVGALIVFFLAPDILPDSLSSLKPFKKEEISDTGVRRFAFQDVGGSFLHNTRSGQLYVIEGEIINNNPKSRSYLLLKGTILDEKGEAVTQKLIYAGNIFSEKQLREMSIEEIDEGLKNRFGQENINVNIKPGGSVPFMVVFENLPDNVVEFEVEAINSSAVE